MLNNNSHINNGQQSQVLKKVQTTFTQIPEHLRRRKDMTPLMKLITGYIYTVSQIPDKDWEVVAGKIETECGISQSSANRAIRTLEEAEVLVLKETRKAGNLPYKVFSINRTELQQFMVPKSGRLNSPDDYTVRMTTPEVKLTSPRSPEDFASGVRMTSTNKILEEEKKEEVQKEEILPEPALLDLGLPCGPVPESVIRRLKEAEMNYNKSLRAAVNIKSSGHSGSQTSPNPSGAILSPKPSVPLGGRVEAPPKVVWTHSGTGSLSQAHRHADPEWQARVSKDTAFFESKFRELFNS